MKECFILRGLPGSGKSTEAKKLAGESGVIHSADNYFMVDGVYRFDIAKRNEYHEQNFEAFCRSVRLGRSPVVVDNTNTRRHHFERYMEYAGRYGYTVRVIEMPALTAEESFRRNTHNVPLEHIEAMIQIWEPYASS